MNKEMTGLDVFWHTIIIFLLIMLLLRIDSIIALLK